MTILESQKEPRELTIFGFKTEWNKSKIKGNKIYDFLSSALDMLRLHLQPSQKPRLSK